MSSVPITKKETGTDDILKLFAEQIKKQKIGQLDTKSLIHLFRPLPESLALSDSLSTDQNRKELLESLSMSDSISSAFYTRFEIGAIDGLHANEAPCKIEFWELMMA
jgi:hypothetical protein